MKVQLDRLRRLSPAKRALLERLVLAREAGGEPPSIARRGDADPTLLSYPEQRLWFVGRLAPDDPFYNMPLAARLRGPLDLRALERALAGIAERHEPLRSAYVLDGGGPRRRLVDRAPPPVAYEDLEGEPDRDAALAARMRVESRKPFDLGRPPLARCCVYRLGDQEHVALLVMHHIVCDGWSMGVMLRELAALYDAARAGRPCPLPPPEIRYRDYAAWQHERLQGEELRGQLDYWLEQLRDAPPSLDLPTDRPRTAVQDFEGATVPLALSASLSGRVRRLSEQAGATPFMTLLAAYAAWLTRMTGQRDVCVGTAVANRPLPELEHLIGFFVNTLVLRLRTAGDPAFSKLLGHARETCLAALARQELPFERLVEALAPERDRSQAPVFQTALVMQNAPRRLQAGADLEIEPLRVDNGTAKHDLSWFVEEADDGRFVGHVEFRTSLLRPETVSRWVESFCTLLADAAERPERRLSELELVSPSERTWLLQLAGGEDGADHGTAEPAHAMFRRHAARTPARPAVRHGGRQLSYAQLARLADRVAAWLEQSPAGFQEAVGVRLERSIELTAVLLGVLQAGRVYLPLDPELPPARLEAMARQAGARVIVTNGRDGRAPLRLDAMTADCRDLLDDRGPPPKHATRRVRPNDLAYIIFTSGTTGAPKGVQIEHRGIANFIRGHCQAMQVGQGDRVLHCMAPCFDGSLAEMFTALAFGACLSIADRTTVVDPAALMDWMEREGVTMGHFAPSLLAMLDPGRLPQLRTVCAAAEPLSAELARRWSRGRRLIHAYGPTETSVGASLIELRPPIPPRPPIGRPMPNVRLYVLDEQLRLTPVGVAGQLYIGGAGVARGYLGQPEATAERFLPDRFSDRPGGRMYASGDLARWTCDGVLEFLGRADRQVKIRGRRIELGEIASALERLPQVAQAHVAALPGPSGEPRLTAYVVPAEEGGEAGSDPGAEEHLSGWRRLFEQAQEEAAALDPEHDFSGWVSSYTGRPLPAEQMRCWADDAAGRILRYAPQDVLEIGCGTGLILLRIAPHCRRCVGTDFLAPALERLRRALRARGGLARRVTLLEQPAHRWDGLPEGAFDLVVLNSVIQYFPGPRYLSAVLREAARRVRPGGRIFLGDVRNLELHEALAASVELARAEPDEARREVWRRAQARLAREEELLAAPALFDALREAWPRPTRVEIQLKDGPADNELTRFRYDVVLHVDAPAPAEPEEELDGEDPQAAMAELERLWARGVQAAAIRGLVNPRTAPHVAAWRLLAAADGPTDAQGVREAVEREAAGRAAVDPGRLRRRAEQIGWETETCWSRMGPDRYDLVVRRPDAAGPRSGRAEGGRGEPPPPPPGPAPDLGRWTNRPTRAKQSQQLAVQLRAALKETLPAYMTPSSFVMVDRIPRTVQGKVDEAALPPPSGERPQWAAGYVAPRDEHERLVADVWEQLLDVRPVGAEDNFFELGGHSLLAVRMTAEVERRSGRPLPLAALFHDPTVRHLAALLRRPETALQAASVAPLQRTGDRPPLFCIHPAGGTVFCYMPLAERFRGRRPVYGIQAVGVDGRHPPHADMEAMAAHYAAAIRHAQPAGPYHLCGWSLGGNIALEVARRLQAEGADVGLLALLDSGRLPADQPLTDDAFLSLVAALFPDQDHAPLEQLRQWSPEQQLRYFVQRAARAGLVPGDDLEAGRHVLRVFQANVKAVHDYEPPPYDGPVVLFRPADQQKTHALVDDPQLGWGPIVRGGVDIVPVPGDHARMVQEPFAARLAEELERRMGEAER